MPAEQLLVPRCVASLNLFSLLNLNDPAERFMAGWISRVHTEPPHQFKAIDLKRAERIASEQADRRVYELARWTGRRPCYMVITWNVDEISMRWHEFRRRSEAVAAYQRLR